MKKIVGAVIMLFLLTGCATLIRGTSETLQITTEPSGAVAKLSTGQSCITPCQVRLKRNQTIYIQFSKKGCENADATVVPTLAGAGVLLGGIIDYGTGAVYSLVPNPVHVILHCKKINNTDNVTSSDEVLKNKKPEK